MIKIFFKLSAICTLFILLFSSCGKDRSGEYYALIGTQTWIYKTMQKEYLYYEELPEENRLNFFKKPHDFLLSLLSSKDQKNGVRFSHVDSIYTEIPASRATSLPSFGFEGVLVRVPNGSEAIRIIYIEKDSPAAEVQLKRGDWIIATNGKKINSNSYSKFVKNPNEACQFTLGNFNGEGFDTLNVVQMPNPRIVDTNNLLETHFITSGNRKAFYILYNEFGNDKESLKSLFAQLAGQQFDDLILDLRYNPGGYVTTSQVLASNLAPEAAFNQPFLKMTSNDIINRNEVFNIDPSLLGGATPLSYTNLYVITTASTASASEIVINGLRPYMQGNLFQVGEATFGKNVAQSRYTDETVPQIELWLTTHSLSNSEDFGDYYTNGLQPEFNISEDLAGKLGNFGTEEDTLMQPILHHMATGSFPTPKEEEVSRSQRIQILFNPIWEKPKLLKLESSIN